MASPGDDRRTCALGDRSRSDRINLDARIVADILGWDVAGWSMALSFWEGWLPATIGRLQVLDVGARDGGVSLYFALRGCDVVCSDLNGPSEKSRELHRRYGVSNRVRYEAVDAVAMTFSDGVFDIVSFKSVLGGVGANDDFALQQQAVREMHRVLKPGGRLLFAENMRASSFHGWARKRFVGWGGRWRYLAMEELGPLFAPFETKDVAFSGFLGAFGRTEWQRRQLHRLDWLCGPLIPDRWKYIVFDCARKAAS